MSICIVNVQLHFHQQCWAPDSQSIWVANCLLSLVSRLFSVPWLSSYLRVLPCLSSVEADAWVYVWHKHLWLIFVFLLCVSQIFLIKSMAFHSTSRCIHRPEFTYIHTHPYTYLSSICRSKNHVALSAKRLWQYLVKQEVVQETFIRNIFPKKRCSTEVCIVSLCITHIHPLHTFSFRNALVIGVI